ncbi:methyl-accepting chemotaxis protein [Pseudomonas sp. 5P_3.1_Bac2]|uniref:methyl-accepting chemotaxis protein n=1 Tax=Pseudomonas sp. 5P_3.1_Bac2 TaxID=2971617 RepID=UPI0021CAA963|nr:methyl-accepting chemotaxis protein [Pseudomonas sp. 5P_3.1_Bac2]MCU1719077.1 methyl-accepting chemotaxis protein [Pseudomonas sp. 5P_3.1_Bac2]
MRSAFVSSPIACLLHTAGLIGLLVLYQQVQVPWYISVSSLLLLGLWPWLGPWQRPEHETVAPTAADQSFSQLSQTLSRHTTQNALAAAQVAHAAGQLSGRLHSQLSATEQINQAAEAITHTEQDNAQRATQTLQAAHSVRANSRSGQQQLREAIQAMQQLSAQTATSRELIDGLSSRTEQIEKVTQVIQSIASQTNLLALNAAIEAARAGDLGRGFAVVADEVRNLAGRTSSATEEVGQIVTDIRQQSSAVVVHMQQQAEQLTQAAAQVEYTGEQLHGIASLAEDVAEQVGQIDSGTRYNHERLAELSVAVGQLRGDVSDSEAQTRQLSQAAERLVGLAESVSEQLSTVGLDDYHQRIYDLARQGAAAIGDKFANDISSGRISLNDLFDRNFQPIANSFPAKYKTRFDAYADQVLPSLQEPLLSQHEGLVFAIATTAEGYVPTHNNAFNHPPTGDRTVDTARSRSKRLFNDRTGLRCGSHQQALLLQTYMRDTGELMHDLSVPIFVQGRHWGGLRLGYKPEP